MVQSVTGRGGNGRGHISPRSHVLVKVVGDTITASWDVTNTGGVTGLAFLDIFFVAPASAFLGDSVSIPAGATVTLSVSGVISTLQPGVTYAAQVRVRALSSATVVPGGIHDFTLTVQAPTRPAPLFPVGSRVNLAILGYPAFLGSVTQNYWTGTRWEDFVVWDPGQSVADGFYQESILTAARTNMGGGTTSPKFSIGQRVKLQYGYSTSGWVYCYGTVIWVSDVPYGGDWYYAMTWDAGDPCAAVIGSTSVKQSALLAA